MKAHSVNEVEGGLKVIPSECYKLICDSLASGRSGMRGIVKVSYSCYRSNVLYFLLIINQRMSMKLFKCLTLWSLTDIEDNNYKWYKGWLRNWSNWRIQNTYTEWLRRQWLSLFDYLVKYQLFVFRWSI